MVKFIKLFIYVLALCTIAIFIILTILEKTLFENSETLSHQKIAKFYSSKSAINLLILGSSRGEGNFIPSILAQDNDGYNFGLPGTENKLWYYMLLDELNNSTSREIIISIDLTEHPIKVGEDYNYNYYLKLPKDTNLYASLEATTKAKILPYPLYYFGNLKEFISQSLKDYINLTTVTDNGFKGNTGKLSLKQFESISNTIIPVTVSFEEKIWIDTFQQIDKSKDTVYFVLAPTFPSNLKHIDYAGFYNRIKHISQKYSKIRFFDFSKSINNRDLFYDPSHLNYNGAIKFSKMLKDSIQKSKLPRGKPTRK